MDDDEIEGLAPSVNNGLSELVAGMTVGEGVGGHGNRLRAAEGSVDDGPREWNEAEGKIVNPCIRLIQVSMIITSALSLDPSTAVLLLHNC